MVVSKGQIISGLVRYAHEEVIGKVTDKPFRMALSVGITLFELKPEIADTYLNNVFLDAVKTENGYDIDILEQVLTKTLDEYGDFPVTIPAIKFVSPTTKELRFTSSDIRKMKEYITGGM